VVDITIENKKTDLDQISY